MSYDGLTKEPADTINAGQSAARFAFVTANECQGGITNDLQASWRGVARPGARRLSTTIIRTLHACSRTRIYIICIPHCVYTSDEPSSAVVQMINATLHEGSRGNVSFLTLCCNKTVSSLKKMYYT